MKISVGSRNPVKIAAVTNVVKNIWPDAEIIPVEVDHGISDQPMSDEEAFKGAMNRAEASLQKTRADLGMGLEGYVVDTRHGMFLSNLVVVLDKNGKIGIGNSGRIALPEKIASEVRKGRELGFVMDDFTGEHNTKQKQGAVGILTNGLITRTDSFETAVIYALVKFLNPDYYE
jgi:inosine/xanthosine triphosphatase